MCSLQEIALLLLVSSAALAVGLTPQQSSDYRKHVFRNVFRLASGEEKGADPVDSGPEIVHFLDNYGIGIDAYLQNDFSGCVYHMETAIQGYREYYDTVVRCRRACETERINHKPLFDENPEHLHFYGAYWQKPSALSAVWATSSPMSPNTFLWTTGTRTSSRRVPLTSTFNSAIIAKMKLRRPSRQRTRCWLYGPRTT